MKKVLMIVCWMAGINIFALPVAKINLRVVDEAGNPIQGAQTAIHFDVYRDKKIFEGVTDSNGLFCAQAETQLCVTELAEKEGYYKSRETPYLKAVNADQTRYEPWGGVHTMTLRKIVDPKEGKIVFRDGIVPKLGQPLGFDIEVGDWVSPYGQGTTSDFILICSNDTTNMVASYCLTFPNKGDGIIECPRDEKEQSVFRWPHQAPLDGYVAVVKKKMTYTINKDPNKLPDYGEISKDTSGIRYIFRIRARYDAQGNITSAYYGKIGGVIMIYRNNELTFGYWLNTDPTSRSLESTNPYSP
jgi:hypothetical protein